MVQIRDANGGLARVYRQGAMTPRRTKARVRSRGAKFVRLFLGVVFRIRLAFVSLVMSCRIEKLEWSRSSGMSTGASTGGSFFSGFRGGTKAKGWSTLELDAGISRVIVE